MSAPKYYLSLSHRVQNWLCLTCPDLALLCTSPLILCSSNVLCDGVLQAVSYSQAISDISMGRDSSLSDSCPPTGLILKDQSTTKASSDLPLASLPTSSPVCSDTTLFIFPHWHISCLIDLSIYLWSVFSTWEWITRMQELDLTKALCSQLFTLTPYWSMFHKHLTNEPKFSLNPHRDVNLQHSGQQPDFDRVSHVKPRLIRLASLLSYLLLNSSCPLILLRNNIYSPHCGCHLTLGMLLTSCSNKIFSCWRILLLTPHVMWSSGPLSPYLPDWDLLWITSTMARPKPRMLDRFWQHGGSSSWKWYCDKKRRK